MRNVANKVLAQVFHVFQLICHQIEVMRQLADLVLRVILHGNIEIAFGDLLGSPRQAFDRLGNMRYGKKMCIRDRYCCARLARAAIGAFLPAAGRKAPTWLFCAAHG